LKIKNKRNDTTSNQQNFNPNNVAFANSLIQNNFICDTWICDSDVCGHYCQFMEEMKNSKEIYGVITIGNGDSMSDSKVCN
jgi:hypothetical protein